MMLGNVTKLFNPKSFRYICRNVSYIQGQAPESKVREYFYFIDHQGMLFLDDSKMKNFTSCFKEKKFLRFFFNQLRINNTNRYSEFPYVSLCGKERNFVRCDDYPIVFTHVIEKSPDEYYLAHNHASEMLTIKFEPQNIFMLPETGRVYHPAYERVGSIGLVQSKLAIQFSSHFMFQNGEENPPTQFTFKGKTYDLLSDWYYRVATKQKSVV